MILFSNLEFHACIKEILYLEIIRMKIYIYNRRLHDFLFTLKNIFQIKIKLKTLIYQVLFNYLSFSHCQN